MDKDKTEEHNKEGNPTEVTLEDNKEEMTEKETMIEEFTEKEMMMTLIEDQEETLDKVYL